MAFAGLAVTILGFVVAVASLQMMTACAMYGYALLFFYLIALLAFFLPLDRFLQGRYHHIHILLEMYEFSPYCGGNGMIKITFCNDINVRYYLIYRT